MTEVGTKPLGDLVDLQRGTTYKSKLLGQPGPVLLGLGTIQRDGGFRGDKLKTYGGESPTKLILFPGDIYVSLKDVTQSGDLLGSVARLPHYVESGRLTQDTVKLEFKEDDFPRHFLYWILRTPEYRQYCRAHATGTTNLGLPREDFLSFPVPELSASRSPILAVLEATEAKIELNRRTNRTLEAMAEAIFRSWFVDFEPVRAKAAAKAAGADSAAIELAAMAVIAGRPIEAAIAEDDCFDDLTLPNRKSLTQTAALFPDSFQDSDLGDIPEGWALRSLDKIATYQNGLALQKFRPKENENPLPIVKIANLKTGEPNWDELASPSINPECILNNGDVVFSWSGSLMVTLWCGGRSALNQHLFKVTSNEFPKWFYFNWTKKHLADFQRIAADKAVTMGHIKRSHLTAAMCTIPAASDLLDEGTKLLNPLVEQIINLELQSRTLAQLRDTLLPKLLSGELPVPDAASQTDEAWT